jgi:hypothetical protein
MSEKPRISFIKACEKNDFELAKWYILNGTDIN